MKTTEYYLRQLDYYRKMLINNLKTLGIECDEKETFNTLVPKIYSLGTNGEIVLSDYSLYQCQLSDEEISYIFDHVVTTSQPTKLDYKFAGCPNLRTVKLYKFDTSKVTSLTNMFKDTPGPLHLDMHGCDLTKKTTMTASDIPNIIETADVTNATLSFVAFNVFFGDKGLLKRIDGLDTVNIVVPDGTVSMYNFLYNMDIDQDISSLLSILEERRVTYYGYSLGYLKSLTHPFILPKCYLAFSGTSNMQFRYFPKCNHVDLSGMELVDIPESITFTRNGNFSNIGNELTEEELEGGVFKLPVNYEKIVHNSLYFTDNKLVDEETIYKMTYSTYTSMNITGTRIKELDYNKFENIIDFGTGPKINVGDMPELERYINNIPGTVCSFNPDDRNTKTANLKNCPKLKYIDFSNVTLTNIHAMFCSPKYSSNQGYLTIPEGLEEMYFDNTIFNDTNTFPSLTSCQNMRIVSFKNAVLAQSFGSKALPSYKVSPETLDLTGLDLSTYNGYYSYLFVDSIRLVNLRMCDNFGKAKRSSYSSIYMKKCINLTKESILDVFNKVYDLNLTYDVANGGTLISNQIQMAPENLAKVTPEEIAIATNKGWTVI